MWQVLEVQTKMFCSLCWRVSQDSGEWFSNVGVPQDHPDLGWDSRICISPSSQVIPMLGVQGTHCEPRSWITSPEPTSLPLVQAESLRCLNFSLPLCGGRSPDWMLTYLALHFTIFITSRDFCSASGIFVNADLTKENGELFSHIRLQTDSQRWLLGNLAFQGQNTAMWALFWI